MNTSVLSWAFTNTQMDPTTSQLNHYIDDNLFWRIGSGAKTETNIFIAPVLIEREESLL